MSIRDELWIDIPRFDRDAITKKFIKGNQAAKGRRVTDAQRAINRKSLAKTRRKCIREGKYIGMRNRIKSVIAINIHTKKFLKFDACVDCEKCLGMVKRSCGNFCNGKVGKDGHRWKDWLLYWEKDTAWFDKV